MTAPDDAARILGVLLAGGASRRMGGGDKCLRPLAGRPLLQHVIDRMRPQVAALVLSANGDPQRFAAFGLPVIADAPPHGGGAEPLQGPLAGVLAALDWAAAQTPPWPDIVTVPTDAPFLPRDLVARLHRARAAAAADLARAHGDGRSQPVIGLWPTALRDDLRAALAGGIRKVDAWTARHRLVDVAFSANSDGGTTDGTEDDADAVAPGPFFNINVPRDLADAERFLRTSTAP